MDFMNMSYVSMRKILLTGRGSVWQTAGFSALEGAIS
jgi:hypothetical protein